DPQTRICSALEPQKVLSHRPGIADQPMRPHQDALAFRCETLKPGGALYKRSIEHLFETLNTKRQSRLGNATAFGGTPKMLLTGQSDHELKFLKHVPALNVDMVWLSGTP